MFSTSQSLSKERKLIMGLILSSAEIKNLIFEIKDGEMFYVGEEFEKLIEKMELEK